MTIQASKFDTFQTAHLQNIKKNIPKYLRLNLTCMNFYTFSCTKKIVSCFSKKKIPMVKPYIQRIKECTALLLHEFMKEKKLKECYNL